MALFKKEKKVRGPEYFTSATNMRTLNYNEYYMSAKEKILYSLLAFVVGAIVSYVFYGGLAKDSYGSNTLTTYILDVVFACVGGFIAIKLFLPARNKALLNNRKIELNHQFRDMLEALTTSLSAGTNIREAFISVRDDMKLQYDENANILQELDIIVVGMYNNVNIEDILNDFGVRSGSADIMSFADVFKTCYRKGGNIKDVIANTRTIINDKIAIKDEIETTVAANKTEQNIMVILPVAIIAMIKLMSSEFAAKFATPSGVVATTVALVIFVASYMLGKKILDIKI